VDVKILITGGAVFPFAEDATGYHPGYVLIEDGRIQAVGEGTPDLAAMDPDETIDATGQAVFPGFINLHSHAALTALRGRAEDVDTVTAVYGLMAPINDALTPEETYAMARLGFFEMMRTGVATVMESSVHMDAVARAAEEMGIRAYLVAGKVHDVVLGGVLEGKYAFDASLGERTLRDALDLVDAWEGRGDGRLGFILGPHATDTCSRDLWERVGEAARERGIGVTTHLLQNTQERDQVMALHGMRPVELLEAVGVLNDDLVAAHCLHISDREMDMMAEAGAHLAHCPAILAKRGSVAPLMPLRARGVNAGIGTDNMSGDMVEAMRFAIAASRIREVSPDTPKPADILWLGTRGGARALGRDADLGSLEAGKRADVTIVDYRAPHTTPVFPETYVSTLLHCGVGTDVSTVLVDGRIVLRDGQLQTADPGEILDEAQRAADAALKRIEARG